MVVVGAFVVVVGAAVVVGGAAVVDVVVVASVVVVVSATSTAASVPGAAASSEASVGTGVTDVANWAPITDPAMRPDAVGGSTTPSAVCAVSTGLAENAAKPITAMSRMMSTPARARGDR